MARAAASHVGATHSGIGLGTVPIDLTVADQIRGMAGSLAVCGVGRISGPATPQFLHPRCDPLRAVAGQNVRAPKAISLGFSRRLEPRLLAPSLR
jgi:hypothetical protein